mmetsp:Transcript_13064/g.45926  ORF Transcript_13064/g.45926 Transcript_13064/m.45926 type:complete len:138 (+) Transcript_13064:343-756(+)
MSVCRWLHEPDRSFDMVEKEEPRTGNSRCDDHHALELYSLFVVTCPKASRHSRHSAVSVQSSYAEIPDFRAIYYIQGPDRLISTILTSCMQVPKGMNRFSTAHGDASQLPRSFRIRGRECPRTTAPQLPSRKVIFSL